MAFKSGWFFISMSPSRNSLNASGKRIEVFRALLANSRNLSCGFFAQRLAAAPGAIMHAAPLGQNVKISLLDMDLRANVCPSPISGQLKTGQDPSFQFLPSILCKKLAVSGKSAL